MNFIIEENRIYLGGENGVTLAEVTFPAISEGVVNVNHTFVDESQRGQGIASKLMKTLAESLREKGKKAYPTCSYAVKWFMDNPEYSDVYVDIME